MQVPAVNYWIMPVGTVAAACMIQGLIWWQRRRRRRRGERPPITRKLLRPPGHTISLRLDVSQEKLLYYLAIAFLSGAVLALLVFVLMPIVFNREVRAWIVANGLQHSLFSHQLLPGVLVNTLLLLSCLCGLVYGIARSVKGINQMRFLHLGLRGEQAVAEALLEAAEHGYRAFHDFPAGEKWNIDHVVVGPAGVFAIETKTRSKRTAPPGKPDHVVEYDGTTLQFPWGPNREYVEQAKRNAKTLAQFLGQATGMKVWVNPVLALPGWYVSHTTNALNHTVQAMPETALAKHLRGLSRSLSHQQIQQIAFQLDQKCRDVEF